MITFGGCPTCGAILTARQVVGYEGIELTLHHCSRNWSIEQLIPPRMLGWRVYESAVFQDVDDPRHMRRLTRERLGGWAGAVCRLERFVGYYLSVFRTRSWPLDRLLHHHRFEHIYSRIQRFIVFGRWVVSRS